MPPLVSIIIPCYNAERWVAQAIQSCLDQTHRPIEILVVDDGSTDETLNVAQRFESSQLKVIYQENRGNGAARNRALQEAQGQFIQYLDADDLLAADKIEVQMERLQREPELCVASGAWARFRASPAEARFCPEPVWKDMRSVDWLVSSWCGGGMMACHAWLTPRSVCAKAGRWNEALSRNVDGEYFARVILQASLILFCPEARVYYRTGASSGTVSGNLSNQGLVDSFRSVDLCVAHLLNVEDSRRTRRAAANLYQFFVYQAYPRVLELVKQAQSRVRELGGSDLDVGGTPGFRILKRLAGWRIARRIEILAVRYNLNRSGIRHRFSRSREKDSMPTGK